MVQAIYPGGPPEVSCSVKAYFVLKLVGDDPQAPHMYFDASRAVAELGFPQSPVERALSRAVEWFRANGYVHG